MSYNLLRECEQVRVQCSVVSRSGVATLEALGPDPLPDTSGSVVGRLDTASRNAGLRCGTVHHYLV